MNKRAIRWSVLAVFALVLGAPAATLTWNADGVAGDPTGGTGTWDTASSLWDNAGTMTTWSSATPDSALFGGTAGTVTLGGAITAGTLTFNTASYVLDLGANALTFTSLAGSSLSSITINGTGGSLVKAGAGDVTLYGNNGYTGGTTISGGVLRAYGSDTALGTGTLSVTGSSTLATANGGGARALANAISISSGQILSIDSGYFSLTLNGNISGAGGLTTVSSGTTTLGGNNTYTGATTIGGAQTLRIAGNTNVGAGTVYLGNGSSVFQILNGGSFTTTGQLSSGVTNAKVQVDAGGNLSVGSLSHSWPANVVVNGTLTSSGAWTFSTGSGANNSISGGGTISVASVSIKNYATVNYSATGSLTVSGQFNMGDAGSQYGNINQSAGTVNLNTATAGGIRIAHSGSETSTYNLTGGTLNAPNSYFGVGWDGTGVFKVSGTGVANLKELKLGASTNNANLFYLGDAFTGNSGGRVNIGASGITKASASTINLGNGTLGAYANWSSSAAMVLTSTTTVNTLDSVDNTTGRTITLSGVLSGTGGLTKAGAGTLKITTRGTYTGATTVNGGILELATPNYGRALTTSGITVNSGATLNINGTNILYDNATPKVYIPITVNAGTVALISTATGSHNHFGALTLNGGTIWGKSTSPYASQYSSLDEDITVGGTATSTIKGDSASFHFGLAAGRSLTFTVGATGDVSGVDLLVSANLGDAGGLTKAGEGTMVLSGVNTYTGATTVNGGTLTVSGSINSASTVNSGAAMNVSAGGTVTGATTVNGSGTLNLSGTVNGLVTINDGGALNIADGWAANTVNVNSGGTVDATGTASGEYILESGRTLKIGRSGAAATDLTGAIVTTDGGALWIGTGTGTVETLTMTGDMVTGGGTIYFDLKGTAGDGDLVSLDGALNSFGTTTLSFNRVDGSLGNGKYNLFYSAGGLGAYDPNLFTTAGIDGSSRQTITLENDGANYVYLDVVGNAATLVWNNGAATSTWSTSETDLNWDTTADDKWFHAGDLVQFRDLDTGTETVTLAGDLAPGSVLVNNTDGDTEYVWTGDGYVSGGGALTKEGTGTLRIENTTDNTFTGAVNINGGILQVETGLVDGGIAGKLGAGTSITFDNGGTLRYTGATTSSDRALTVGAGGGALDVATAGTTVTLTSAINATGLFTKKGNGNLTLNTSNTFTGGLRIEGGVVSGTVAASLGNLTTGNEVAIATGGALDLAGINRSTNRFNLTIEGTGVGGGGAVYNSGTTIWGNSGVDAVTLTGDATVSAGGGRWDMGPNGSLNLAGFTLSKIGGYDLIIKSAPSTTGTLRAAQGLLGVEGNFNGADTAKVSVEVVAGATFGAWNLYNGQDIQSPITLNGETATLASYGGTWNNYSGALTLVGGGKIGSGVRYNGAMGGSGNLILAPGTGSVYMTGTQVFSGVTPTIMDLQSGYLEINGAAGTLDSNAVLNIGAGADATRAVDLYSGNMTVRGLTGGTASTKIVSNGGRTLLLNTPEGESYDFAGVVANSTWAGTTLKLTKQGAGTQILSGANTYTGATSVNGGTLHISSTGSLAATDITVNDGGTLRVDGAAAGVVTINTGGTLMGTGTTGGLNIYGTLSPGASIESMESAGNVTFNTDSLYEYELDTSNLGEELLGGDLLIVLGDLNITDAELTLTDLAAVPLPTAGGKLTLMGYTGAWNNGTFKYDGGTVTDDAAFTITMSGGSYFATVNYDDDTRGTNFTGDLDAHTFTGYVTMNIVAIPEPGTLGILGACLAVSFLRRRR